MPEFQTRDPYWRERRAVVFDHEKDRTQQSFADQADVNQIMKRALRGQPLPAGERKPRYEDFAAVGDFRELHQRMAEADDLFMSLPSVVRDLAGNDPVRFGELLEDPEFLDQVEAELGEAFGRPAPAEPGEPGAPPEPAPSAPQPAPEPSPAPAPSPEPGPSPT